MNKGTLLYIKLDPSNKLSRVKKEEEQKEGSEVTKEETSLINKHKCTIIFPSAETNARQCFSSPTPFQIQLFARRTQKTQKQFVLMAKVYYSK